MSEGRAFVDLEAERASLPNDHSEASAPQPRDAGTLVIVDDSGETPMILMGRRAAGHIFMPNRYVFPGGRVDPVDLTLAADHPLDDNQCARLTGRTPSGFGPREAAATALAAIRETCEETGALIGEAGEFTFTTGTWSRFAERNVRPAPRHLVPFARAITPPGPPRRYDTRFFCVPASALIVPPSLDALPSDELEDVAWVPVDGFGDRSIAPITLRILDELKIRLDDGSWHDSSRPIPLYRYEDGQFTRDLI